MLKLLVLQMIVGMGSAAAFGLFDGVVAAYSALLGGLVVVVPNAFLAMRLAMSRREGGAGALLRAAWLGEAGKMALTVVMCTAVFVLVRPLSAAALLVTFVLVQLATLAGLLMRDEEQQDLNTEPRNGG